MKKLIIRGVGTEREGHVVVQALIEWTLYRFAPLAHCLGIGIKALLENATEYMLDLIGATPEGKKELIGF